MGFAALATGVQRGLWELGEREGDGPAGAAPSPGLSYAHKWTQGTGEEAGSARVESPPIGHFRLKVPTNGACCRLSEVGAKRPSASLEGCKRGEVNGFSHASRLRMMELLNSIDRSKVAEIFFTTHTVPRGERDFKGIERDRRLWVKRFERQFPGMASIVWKKEPHKSGTPHLHGLVFWWVKPPSLGEFRAWNDAAWADVVKSVNPAHRDRGCRVERMRGWGGVVHYASKYIGKTSEVAVKESGRIWGVHNRKLLAVSISEEVLEPEVGKRMRRTLRKLQERKKSHWQERIQRKDGGYFWVKLRAQSVRLAKNSLSFEYFTVESQVRSIQRSGGKCRFVKGRALARRVVDVWGEVTESSLCLGEVTRREKVGTEVHSFAPSLHFVASGEVERLREFYKRQCADDALEAAELPF